MNQSDPVGEEKAMSFESYYKEHYCIPYAENGYGQYVKDAFDAGRASLEAEMIEYRNGNVRLKAELAKVKEELADAQKYTCKIVAGPAVDALRAERDALKAALEQSQEAILEAHRLLIWASWLQTAQVSPKVVSEINAVIKVLDDALTKEEPLEASNADNSPSSDSALKTKEKGE